MKTEGLNVELKNIGWHPFKPRNLTLERQERLLATTEGEYEFAGIRGALVKLFPDSIIQRKPQLVADKKSNDRLRTNSTDLVMDTGRYTAHE